MAGLTREGFTPSTHKEILDRIGVRLEAFSAGIDLSSESPDGQLVEIFSFELSQVWSELGLVYNSYNPLEAEGDGLRNLGLLSGLPYGAATRSQTVVDFVGTTGTLVPRGTIVANDNGDEFTSTFDAIIPSSVPVVSTVAGIVNVDASTVTTIVTAVAGLVSINNPNDGRVGLAPQTDVQYRNLRNRTVLRNYKAVTEVIKGRLMENLEIKQVAVLNNDSLSTTLTDGTPPNHIHVTVGEIDPAVTDEDIAKIILATKSLGCPTFGSTTITVNDVQGSPHDVSFSKAVAKNVYMNIEILFLDEDYAGAEESIMADLITHINSLDTSEDVIWSRLFGIITPYAKAQVDVLEISSDGVTYGTANIPVGSDEYAATVEGNINITVVN